MIRARGRQIRGEGINREPVLHAEEMAPDDWRAVDLERNGGIFIYSYQMLITRIADLIGQGYVYWLTAGGQEVPIDRARNIWLGSKYLPPDQYLPILIPREVP